MSYIGSYELLGPVVNSATGTLWRGRDHTLGRDVALKQVALWAVESVARLRTEAQILARLSHPNIVTVIDLIEADGQLWLVEEWVDGAILPALLAQTGRLSPQQAIGVVRGALQGLGHAHRNGVVHGDLSPSNVLFDLAGTSKLIDFGLAGPAGVPGIAGTPGYLSPEAAYRQPLVPASDVYSAGAVLATLLRGRGLFEGPTAEAVLAAQFRPGQLEIGGVRGPLRSVLIQAMAPAAAQRFADADQFLVALDDAAERSYGADWFAAAGVAGLVAAVMSTGAVMGLSVGLAPAAPGALNAAPGTFNAGAPFAAPPAAPAPGAPVAAPAPSVHPAAQNIASKQRSFARLARRFRPRTLAIGAGATAATAAVAVVIAVTVAGHDKAAPKPAAASSVLRTSAVPAASTTPAFDLRTVDWSNITVPGKVCFSATDIVLKDGKATIPIPGDANGSYSVSIGIAPTYGQLGTGGPAVAVLGLSCTAMGDVAGSHPQRPTTVAVYDAVQGQPHALGYISNLDLGRVDQSGSALVPAQLQVQDGQVVATGDYLTSTDPACCPTGHGTTTISYANGALVPSKIITPTTGTATAPASTQPSAANRTISFTASSGRTYVATVLAEDHFADCAANAYGSAIVNFLRQHPCGRGASRRLVTIPLNGRTVALSIVTAGIPGTSADLYGNAEEFTRLLRANGTGSLNDLLRAGVRPAGWPASIPANEAFLVAGEDTQVYIFDAWYLTGSTTDQAPELVAMENDLFLSPITAIGG